MAYDDITRMSVNYIGQKLINFQNMLNIGQNLLEGMLKMKAQVCLLDANLNSTIVIMQW